jgi:hypothetical protein
VDCQPTALRQTVQERQETTQTTKLIEHGDDDHFVINLNALHNATLLRRALPVALTVPRPLYLDRKTHHYNIAKGLRVSQLMKRARTQEKRKATMAAKALQKGLVLEAQGEGDDDTETEDSDDGDKIISQAGTSKKRPRKRVKKT